MGEVGDRNKRDVPGRLLCFQRAKAGARETLLVLHNIMKVIINAVSEHQGSPKQGVEYNHDAKELARPRSAIVIILEALHNCVTET